MHKTTSHNIRVLALSVWGLLFMVSCHNINNVEPQQEVATLKTDERLVQKADSGDMKAQYDLGIFYEDNLHYIEAVKYYKEAAHQNHAESEYKLGGAYFNGFGVILDQDSAIHYYQKAAEHGCPDAQIDLGAFYENGVCVEKDLSKAAFWYAKAAEKGIPMAQYRLGYLYFNGQGVEQDNEKAVHYLREAANYGLPIAQYNLGLIYRDGDLVKRDQNKYILWVKKAAEQGYGNAMIEMAYLHEQGIVTDENMPKNENRQYVVPAQNNFNEKLITTLSPDLKKQEKSKKTIRIEPLKADEIKTEADQFYQEGFKLMFGNYGDLNVYAQAINYLCQAAVAGKKEAKALLAYCYATGNGIDPNPDVAPYLYVGKGIIKWKGLDGVYTINFEVFYDGTYTKDMEYQR